MRLIHLQADNLHGHLTYDVEVGPVTVILGANEAGKSTLLGVPALVLDGPKRGNYPVLGQSPSYSWFAAVAFDDGTVVTRQMTGGTHGATFNGDAAGITVVQQRIERLIGEGGTWSLSAFMALSSAKQLDALEERVLVGAGWTRERALEELAPHLPTLRARLYLADDWVPEGTAREILNDIQARLQALFTETDRTVKRLQQTCAQDEVEATAEAERLPGGTVPYWRAELARLDKELGEAEASKGIYEGQRQGREALEAEVAKVEADLDALVIPVGDLVASVQDARQALAAARQTLEDAVATEGEAAATVQQLQRQAQGLQAERAGAMSAKQIAEAAGAGVAEALAGIEGVVGAVMLSDDHVDVLRRAVDRIRSLVPSLYDAEQAVTAVDQKIAGLGVQVSSAERRVARTAQAAAEARGQAAVAGVTVANAEAIVTEAAEARRRRDELEQRLAALRLRLADLVTGDVGSIEDRIAGLQEARSTAVRNHDALNDAVAARVLRSDHTVQRQAAIELRTMVRRELTTITSMRSRALTATVEPLVEAMNPITLRAMGVQVSITLDGGFSLRLERPDGTQVPYETATASQVAIVGAALELAVRQRLGGWRRLLIDNLNDLDADRRTRFVEAMLALADEGLVDNVLLASVEDGWAPPEGVTLVRLGA